MTGVCRHLSIPDVKRLVQTLISRKFLAEETMVIPKTRTFTMTLQYIRLGERATDITQHNQTFMFSVSTVKKTEASYNRSRSTWRGGRGGRGWYGGGGRRLGGDPTKSLLELMHFWSHCNFHIFLLPSNVKVLPVPFLLLLIPFNPAIVFYLPVSVFVVVAIKRILLGQKRLILSTINLI